MERLQPFADDVFVVEGSTVPFFGVPYPTRMVIIRLPEGLWVWSPVAIDDALFDEVSRLGEVKWVVEPNKIHHLFLPPWLERFPEAKAYAPPGLAPRKPEVTFAAELDDAPPPEWGEDIDQVIVHGSPAMEEVLFFHRPSSTCLVGDLIQRHDPEAMTHWQRFIMKADGLTGDEGSTPREWRATFFDRGPGRKALDKAMGWHPERLIIAHGECAAEGGAKVLATGLEWLKKPWPV